MFQIPFHPIFLEGIKNVKIVHVEDLGHVYCNSE